MKLQHFPLTLTLSFRPQRVLMERGRKTFLAANQYVSLQFMQMIIALHLVYNKL